MEIFRSTAEFAAGPKRLQTANAVTIGNFDGVHRGHRLVLGELVATAKRLAVPAVVLTFDPHPAAVHSPEHAPKLIMGLDEKLDKIAETGVDAVLVQHYTLDFAQASPEEFIRDYLAGHMHASAVVVGSDVRFGRENSGDLNTLRTYGGECGIDTVIGLDDLGDDGGRYSSTEVRSLIDAGDVTAAAHILGEPHSVTGTVVHGNARGRELGFPTANLGLVDGMIPADGVYAGWTRFNGGERLPTAISVGSNPTFYGDDRRVEAHIIGVDFADLDVYGDEAEVEFTHRIRGQVVFNGLDQLIEQIALDVRDICAALGIECPQQSEGRLG